MSNKKKNLETVVESENLETVVESNEVIENDIVEEKPVEKTTVSGGPVRL